MKIRELSLIILLSTMLALGFAAPAGERASAACYNGQKEEIPCEKEKNPEREKQAAPTAVPVKSATPTPTDIPKPTPTNTPDAARSAILSAPPSTAGNGSLNAGVSDPDPAAAPTPSRFPFSPLLLGGGGLLGGLALGVLLGRSVIRPDRGSGAPPAVRSPGGPNLGSMTLEDAAQMIVLLTSADAHQDMRDMLHQMQDENKRKEAVRQFVDGAKTRGSANELPDSTAKQLQDGMDRMSKFQDALSNALKKAQDTAEGIAGTLK